jgi:hypothetical protein
VNNQKYISFEYDGNQHDEYPNGYHKSKNEFRRQTYNDRRKDFLAQKYNTFLIRLKEYNGFTYKTKELFPNEILRLFQIKSNQI